jgi:hypothetical protein
MKRSQVSGSEDCVAAGNVANDIPLFEILEISDMTYPSAPNALPIWKEDSPLRRQNQPPDGTTSLMRRYVTRLP